MTERFFVRFSCRGYTAAEWVAMSAPQNILNDREIGIETDTDKFKFGDGVTEWDALPYITGDLPAALAQIAALTPSNDDFLQRKAGVWSNRTIAQVKVDLAYGTMSGQNASSVTITGGSITGITDLAIADGGTGASTASAARTNLGCGTAAAANTGTSGGTVPLLDGSGNTWTNAQLMPAVNFTGGSSVPIARRRVFGYGASYNALVLGGQSNTAVALIDVAGIAGGTFSADGNELIVGNACKITAVNPAGTDFISRVLSFPSGVYRGRAFTVANLPAAATVGDAARAYVTDANATTFASVVVGGGSNKVPVYSDGTDWRIG
jgi:hypothetical protein